MKKLWGWIKDHWIVVVCCALIVLSLPLAFFFSQRWAGSVQSRQEKAANDLLTKLNTSSKVNYAVPSVVPGVPAMEQSAEPNAKRTAFFKAQKDSIVGAASGVIAAAEKFNQRGHGLIMEGLFPDPSPQEEDSLTLEFAERIVGRTSQTGQVLRPSVYQKLFDAIKAGPPADPVRLATMLEDRRLRAIEQKKGAEGAGRSLTKEEEEEITKGLTNDRLSEYQRRAREISVYASMDVLPAPSEAREGGSWVPREMPKSPPKVWECFSWQFDYWVIDDLLAAVGRANTGPDGRLLPVEDAVVKRIEKIKLDESGFVSREGVQQRRRGGTDEAAAEEAKASATDEVKPDFKESLTGRTAAPINKANGVYDIRKAEMTVIVSSARLPQLLSAISATNFMTVVDCDLSEVNVWSDLAQGYYYGNEHVVRARLTIETVWLRSLTQPLMPHAVREQLNIPEPEKPAEGEAPAEGEKPAGGPG